MLNLVSWVADSDGFNQDRFMPGWLLSRVCDWRLGLQYDVCCQRQETPMAIPAITAVQVIKLVRLPVLCALCCDDAAITLRQLAAAGAAEEAGRHPNAFNPWGFGVRACIGSQFALWEGKLFLCMVLHCFK
jgi:hypothetical protein